MNPDLIPAYLVRRAILEIMTDRPICTSSTPAARDGRMDDLEHICQWPVHPDATIVGRRSPNTVLVRCPHCTYSWAQYNDTWKGLAVDAQGQKLKVKSQGKTYRVAT